MSSVLSNLAPCSSFPLGTAELLYGLQIEPIEHVQLASIAALRTAGGRLDERIRSLFQLSLPRRAALTRAGAVRLLGTAPGRWLAVHEGPDRIVTRLAEELTGLAAVCDVSSAYGVLRVLGSRARDLLCGGMFVDLHPSRFDAETVAVSALGDFSVVLWRAEEECSFYMAVPRSNAVDVWQWLYRRARQMDAQAEACADAS